MSDLTLPALDDKSIHSSLDSLMAQMMDTLMVENSRLVDSLERKKAAKLEAMSGDLMASESAR